MSVIDHHVQISYLQMYTTKENSNQGYAKMTVSLLSHPVLANKTGSST